MTEAVVLARRDKVRLRQCADIQVYFCLGRLHLPESGVEARFFPLTASGSVTIAHAYQAKLLTELFITCKMFARNLFGQSATS